MRAVVPARRVLPVQSGTIRTVLSVVAWFNLVSALVGMVGLTVGGGLGLPLTRIEGSGFASHFWPGINLGVVVGEP